MSGSTSTPAVALVGRTLSSLAFAISSIVASQSLSAAEADLFEQYCTKCHNLDDYAGGIDLEGLNAGNVHEHPEIGEKVIRRLRAGMMPPVGEARPDNDTMQAFAAALEQNIDASAEIKAGRPGLHRMNRAEYANAVRDLLNVNIVPADYFPADDSSRGFDNQAGTLTLSPALLEAYLSASAKISKIALGTDQAPSQKLYRAAEDANQNYRLEGMPFGTRGGIKFTHTFPVDGEYTFKTFAITLGNMGSDRPFGEIRGEKLQVLVDGELVKTFDWDSELGVTRSSFERNDDEVTGENLPTLDVTLPLTAGQHEIGITFVATNFAPGLDMNNDFERSTIETGGLPGFTWYPHVGSVRVDGPYNVSGAGESPSRQAILVCRPANDDEETGCAQQIIEHLANLAYRGHATQDDVATLMGFYRLGRESGNFDAGIEMALQRILASPKFIYRIEQEPADVAVGEDYRISDLDLASRLSYFLWSSIPDQELLDLAKAGKLSDRQVLSKQVSRMLEDPRSYAMTANFAGQWLALRNLSAHAPVVDQFPDFDNLLRESFRTETELLFDSLIRENHPVSELLTADYTFVNERLALHYGIPGVKGERFRRVDLKGDALELRHGILGKGSMLTVAAQPGRTSPVMRGFWTLANIIGVEPPPPPPNVPALEAKTGDAAGNGRLPSMREQMEEHRQNAACQGCHRLMDPIGFALENFDAVGKFRTVDNGSPIDTSGVLYDGTEITNAADLPKFLLSHEKSFNRNATQRMLTYALGRGMEYEDMPLVRQVQAEAEREGFRFHALINAVVNSKAFLYNTKEALPTTSSVSSAARSVASIRGE